MRVRFLGSTNTPLVGPAASAVVGASYSLFPMQGQPTATPAADSAFPVLLSPDEAVEIWARVVQFDVSFSGLFDGGISIAGSATLTNTSATGNEARALDPTAGEWTGSFSGSDPNQTVSFVFKYMKPPTADPQKPAYYWIEGDVVQPYFTLVVTVTWDVGTEVTGVLVTETPAPDPLDVFRSTKSVNIKGHIVGATWAGGSVACNSVSCIVSPSLWFEYRDASNLNPIWDASDGAQLLPLNSPD